MLWRLGENKYVPGRGLDFAEAIFRVGKHKNLKNLITDFTKSVSWEENLHFKGF